MRYLGPVFKKARRYGISILENEKEFSKGKNVPMHLVNMVINVLNFLTMDCTYMKNKK